MSLPGCCSVFSGLLLQVLLSWFFLLFGRVLSTLHTNDAPSTVNRLPDMVTEAECRYRLL